MNLDPIRDYLQSKTLLTVGVDLFTYSMPNSINFGVLLIQNTAGNFVDHEIKGIYKARFQAIVRAQDYNDGYSMARDVFSILDVERLSLPEYEIDYMRPRNTPFPMPRSDGDLIEFSVNFDIRYRDA